MLACKEIKEVIHNALNMQGRGKYILALAVILSFSSLACSGEDGTDGADGINGVNGTNASIQTSVLEIGDENCPNGGVKIDVLSDGIIQEDQTQYLCHGATGAQGETGSQGAAGENGAQGLPGENGTDGVDSVCANNMKPEIAVELEDALIYQSGKTYSLSVSANKAGLKYSFVAPLITIELAEAETEVDGRYVTLYAVTPEKGDFDAVIMATDDCQIALATFSGKKKFILIPAGTLASKNVDLDAFFMAKTPTTVTQFKACVDAGACSSDNYGVIADNQLCNYDRGDAWLNHPMNCVNWDGANEFCAWIGGRLPSADEWQYAATHNGTEALETTYPWGDEVPRHCEHANYWVSQGNVFCDGTTPIAGTKLGSSAVGSYSPTGDSPLGLQDMVGNVFEWTSTLDSESTSVRYIMKGSYFYNVERWLDISEEFPNQRSTKSDSEGFRCVIDVE